MLLNVSVIVGIVGTCTLGEGGSDSRTILSGIVLPVKAACAAVEPVRKWFVGVYTRRSEVCAKALVV